MIRDAWEQVEDRMACPACDEERQDVSIRAQLGWLVAVGFLLLWAFDSQLGRFLAALLIEVMG